MLTLGGVTATAALALALPIDKLRTIDFSAEARDRAADVLTVAGFGIDQVSITGQRHAADNDIYDALDLPNVRTFADFDSAAALKRIERIPWIDTAQITRAYPSGLDVAVQERVPAVIWKRAGVEYLVDAEGRVLGPNPQPNEWALPLVVGEGAAKEAAVLSTALQPYPVIARGLVYAERVSERRWRLIFKNGTKVELGPDRESDGLADLASRSQLMASLEGAPQEIDLRIVGRVTMRPLADARRQATAATPSHRS